jgi:hypothetical protein
MSSQQSQPDMVIDYDDPKNYTTILEASKQYNLHPTTIKEWCKKGKIKAKRENLKTSPWLVHIESLAEYIKNTASNTTSQPVDNSQGKLIANYENTINILQDQLQKKDEQISQLITQQDGFRELSHNFQGLLLNSQKLSSYNPSENGFVIVDNQTPKEDIKQPENENIEVKPKKSKSWMKFWSR